jgi:hypothetical protein
MLGAVVADIGRSVASQCRTGTASVPGVVLVVVEPPSASRRWRRRRDGGEQDIRRLAHQFQFPQQTQPAPDSYDVAS